MSRNPVFDKLSPFGLSSKMMRILQLLYFKTVARVWDGYNYSNQFPVDVGVKQGCILSPSPSDLQSIINCLLNYCMKWYLNVNLAKAKILILRTGNKV